MADAPAAAPEPSAEEVPGRKMAEAEVGQARSRAEVEGAPAVLNLGSVRRRQHGWLPGRRDGVKAPHLWVEVVAVVYDALELLGEVEARRKEAAVVARVERLAPKNWAVEAAELRDGSPMTASGSPGVAEAFYLSGAAGLSRRLSRPSRLVCRPC